MKGLEKKYHSHLVYNVEAPATRPQIMRPQHTFPPVLLGEFSTFSQK